jgi:DNA-cytosine methyltransferase
MKLRHLDLFSGIGGFSLGLEATGGFETVAFCEIEEFPRKVLQKHWPYVKQYKDIKELTYEKLKADGLVPIDIITGGYPCQPFSQAGRKRGESDPRHLWPEMFRIIKDLRPTWVVAENVSGHIKLGLDSVLSDLALQDYAARTFSLSASSVGANHKRERVWIVAHSERNGDKHTLQGVNGEEKEIQRECGTNNSSSWKSSGTDSVRQANDGNVENTRRPLQPRAEQRGENENETRKENADLAQRSSEASQSDVADTDKWKNNARDESKPREEKQFELSSNSSSERGAVADTENIRSVLSSYEKEREGNSSRRRKGKSEGSSAVADAVEGDAQARRERQREVREGHQEEGIPGDASGSSENTWERWWTVEPDVGRVAHGIPDRVHRLKALGNSLIPPLPFYIGQSILKTYSKDEDEKTD